jgi:hypothetical protein
MTKQAMLKEMCLELSQADLRAIGQSRGFDPEAIACRELLRHVFLSERGVHPALASLTEAEPLVKECLKKLNEAYAVAVEDIEA